MHLKKLVQGNMWLPLVLLATSAYAQIPLSPVDGRSLLRGGIDERIIGGMEASPHHVPFQALIEVFFQYAPRSICGGVLIREQWVLTAGNCVMTSRSAGFGRVFVYLGVPDRLNQDRNRQKFKPEGIFVTDGFLELLARENWSQDLALIKLHRPAVLTNYVNTIRVPPGCDKEKTFENHLATVAGWGLTTTLDDCTEEDGKLRLVRVKVISNHQCETAFGAKHVFDTTICTSGEDGKGICNGDSGGPLYIHDSDGKPLLVGIASFVYQTCEAGLPSGFIRITKFLDWINNTIAYNS